MLASSSSSFPPKTLLDPPCPFSDRTGGGGGGGGGGGKNLRCFSLLMGIPRRELRTLKNARAQPSGHFGLDCFLPVICRNVPYRILDQAAEAVRCVVAAAPPGALNWDVNKDRSLWNCVTIAGAGDRFAVNFRSFTFRSRLDLADLARIFGTELVSLKVDDQGKLEGKRALFVNRDHWYVSRIVLFADQSAHESFPVRSQIAPRKFFR